MTLLSLSCQGSFLDTVWLWLRAGSPMATMGLERWTMALNQAPRSPVGSQTLVTQKPCWSLASHHGLVGWHTSHAHRQALVQQAESATSTLRYLDWVAASAVGLAQVQSSLWCAGQSGWPTVCGLGATRLLAAERLASSHDKPPNGWSFASPPTRQKGTATSLCPASIH
jgi:hypothetical protein